MISILRILGVIFSSFNDRLDLMFAIFSCLSIANVSICNTIVVPADYTSIQDAVNASVNGDTILVENGIYYENDISLSGKDIVLISRNGPSVTTIDGSSSGGIIDCISGESFNTEINGFTLQNGQANEGAAIHIINSSYLTVRNCVIKNNSAPGIWTRACITIGQEYNNGPHTSAGIKMYDCIIEYNSGFYGGGVFNEESGTTSSIFENCIFRYNTGENGAAVFGTRNSVFRRCLFYRNTALNATSVIHNENGYPTIINCTFSNNNAYALCRNSASNTTEIRNCIFYGNTGTWCQITEESTILMEYSNDEDNFSGTGNISLNPLFANEQSDDYRLRLGSPCIDAGDPDPAYNDPDGSRNDIGVYYYVELPQNVGINIPDPQRSLHIKDVLRLEPRSAPPDNPSQGDIYFDSSLNKLRVYDGTTWQDCW